MKKAALFLNGDIDIPAHCVDLTHYDLIAAVDGGYDKLKKLFPDIQCDILIGDMDSIEEPVNIQNLEIIKFPTQKDATDGELAIIELSKRQINEIDIFFARGSRIDHELGNFILLSVAKDLNINAKIITSDCMIFLCENQEFYIPQIFDIISLVPFFGRVHIKSTNGLKYPLRDFWLSPNTLGISNERLDEDAAVTVGEGRVLVVCTKRR